MDLRHRQRRLRNSLGTPSLCSGMALFGVMLVGVALVGCAGDDLAPEAAFENLSVRVDALDGREVQLRNRYAEVIDSGVEVLLDDLHHTGVLLAPDHTVTTGVLYVNGPEFEPRSEMVIATRNRRRMTHISSFPLGERVRVEGIRYRDGTIILDLHEYDADDPPCCPTMMRQRHFHLHEGQVSEAGVDAEAEADAEADP